MWSGVDSESIGFVGADRGKRSYSFNKPQWRLRTSDRMERCLACPYAFLCRGGCAADAKRESGSYFREHCGELAEIFAYAAPRVMGRRWEEDGEDELSASLHGPLSRMAREEREELMATDSGKRVVELLRQTGLMFAEKDQV